MSTEVGAIQREKAFSLDGVPAWLWLGIGVYALVLIEGINVARRDVQLELAAQVGLDLTRFVERLDDSHLEPEVTDSVEEAEALGIKGVPALVIGGEWLMQGCRDLTEYRQVIDKYLRERVAPAQMRMMH